MEKLIKYKKWIYLGLGLAVLAAALLPLFNLRIEFLGMDTTIEFSLRTVFQNVGGSSNEISLGSNLNLGQSNTMSDIIMPFGAYLLALLLIIIGTALVFFDKIKTATTTIILSVAFGLMIYVGFGLTNLPNVIGYAITEMIGNNLLMGLFVSMINISEIVTIGLGVGYWLMIILIVLFVLVKLPLDINSKQW